MFTCKFTLLSAHTKLSAYESKNSICEIKLLCAWNNQYSGEKKCIAIMKIITSCLATYNKLFLAGKEKLVVYY